MPEPQTSGTIVQCIGAVIDIEFPREAMPGIYDALLLEDSGEKSFSETGLTFEVEQQLGDGVVRCIALGSSDGLRRGMKVKNSGSPISVPIGRPSTSMMRPSVPFPTGTEIGLPLAPPDRAQVRRALAFGRAPRDRHQGDRPHLPVREGRQ